MRIDQLGAPLNLSENLSRPALSEGDVIVSRVVEISGDQVILKNQDGAMVSAKLLADIGVAVGDYIETVVDEAAGGRYVLRVLNVSREVPIPTAETPEALVGQTRTLDAAKLMNMLATLKMNPGADPKAAAFLARYGLAGTAENLEAIANLAKSNAPLADTLQGIVNNAAQPNAAQSNTAHPQVMGNGGLADVSHTTQAASAQPVMPETIPAQVFVQTGGTPETAIQSDSLTQADVLLGQSVDHSSAVSPEVAAQSVAARPADTATTHTSQPQPTNGAPEKSAIQNPTAPVSAPLAQTLPTSETGRSQGVPTQTGDAIQAQISVDASSDVAKQATQANAALQSGGKVVAPAENTDAQPMREAPAAMPEQAAQTTQSAHSSLPMNAAKDDMGLEFLAQKAAALLGRLDDADRLTVHLRRVVEEMPEQLKELKSLVNRTDINNKESIMTQLDQADRQAALLGDIRRFDCYQIPLTNGHRDTTAELYVFRRRNRKSAEEADNIVIMIGLDTEHMGRVETLVRAEGKVVNIEFHIEDMDAKGVMEADLGQMEKAIKEIGYTLKAVNVSELKERTTVLNAEEILMKAAPGNAGNLDIRI